jgi:hypothetical protein
VALVSHEGMSTVTDSLSDVAMRSFNIALNCMMTGRKMSNVTVFGMTKGTDLVPLQQQIQKLE